jgi:hypothetical protein
VQRFQGVASLLENGHFSQTVVHGCWPWPWRESQKRPPFVGLAVVPAGSMLSALNNHLIVHLGIWIGISTKTPHLNVYSFILLCFTLNSTVNAGTRVPLLQGKLTTRLPVSDMQPHFPFPRPRTLERGKFAFMRRAGASSRLLLATGRNIVAWRGISALILAQTIAVYGLHR